jgi:hypothetical protein
LDLSVVEWPVASFVDPGNIPSRQAITPAGMQSIFARDCSRRDAVCDVLNTLAQARAVTAAPQMLHIAAPYAQKLILETIASPITSKACLSS